MRSGESWPDKRKDDAVTGLVNTRLSSTCVFPVTAAPGMVTHVLPSRYCTLNVPTGWVSFSPMKTCALPTSTGKGKSMRALFHVLFALCQRLSLPVTPSVT
jgi:hypothetical protein